MPDNAFDSSSAGKKAGKARSAGRRLLALGFALGVLWLFMYVIGPFLVDSIRPFGEYARTVDETGIMPGALYYTDVPQTKDAEVNNRNAIRFMVGRDKKDR